MALAHLDHYPHAITIHGECTIHQAVLSDEPIIAIREIDGDTHSPTDADLLLIQAEQDECGG
jgi:hypothetical protein